MKTTLWFLILFLLLQTLPTPRHLTAAETATTAEMLRSFVEDFRDDLTVKKQALTFGIQVKDDGEWTVIVDGKGGVELKSGLPEHPTIYYILADRKTLTELHTGRKNALTLAGKARSTDFAPLDFGLMDGFSPTPEFFQMFIPLTFHFWTRGQPEIVKFGDKRSTREVHGANATVLYYQEGFRSAWFQIEKGQHVNKEEQDQVNPFPTLLLMIRGQIHARIGGREIIFEKGEAIFIPAGVSHEFWNVRDEPAECVLLMFGEGA
jgi:quercetin dioxygenase-like cupin family protein